MSNFFFNLGRKAGPKIRKAKWTVAALTSTEAEIIAAEYAVGVDMAGFVRKQYGGCPDTRLSQTLKAVGEQLAGRVKNKQRRFSFECIAGGSPQAFCLPGGFIFVNDSMLELCCSDRDKIAFIFGHEMGHCILGHVMERMASNTIISAVSAAAVVRNAAVDALKKLGVHFLQNAYSQDHELEADELGYRLAVAAGFKADASTELFSRLKQSQQQPLLGQYFSTHPPFSIRIERLSRLQKEK